MDGNSSVSPERQTLLGSSAAATATSNSPAALQAGPTFDAASYAAAADGANVSPDALQAPATKAELQDVPLPGSPSKPSPARLNPRSSAGGGGSSGRKQHWRRSLSAAGVAAAVATGFLAAMIFRAVLMQGGSLPAVSVPEVDLKGWRDHAAEGASTIIGHLHSKSVPPGCQRYVPTSCYFLPGLLPRQGPAPSVRVDFDVGDVLGQCPFASGGRFLNVPGPWCMGPQPPFWQESQLPAGRRPTCGPGAACCGNNSVAGDFYRDDAGRHQFDSSAMGCTYHEYRRKDVLKCLARPNGQAALAMIGDSMTRQMFMRLISEFRGEERSFDYGPHTGARYDVCGGPFPADRFSVAFQNEGQHPFAQVDELPLDGLHNGRFYMGPSPLDMCREPPIALDYVWAADMVWHTHQIRRYILRHDMREVVMTILCTYHDQNAHLDLIWLNAINEAASVAKKVILMTIPLATYKPDFAPYIPIWEERNQRLREWVKQQPLYNKKLVLLDFDLMSKMKHAPTPLEGRDWHFQCIFNFEPPATGMPMKAARHVEHRFLNPTGWALHRMIVDEDRDCIDDMNRVMMNAILNIACNEE